MSVLEVEHLTKTFRSLGRPPVTVLRDVDLQVDRGQITGLVGESGSGKTTLIRCIMGLEVPDHGSIRYEGIDLVRIGRAERQRTRREIQLVFQDPTASLNPRMTVEQLVGEGIRVHKLRPSAASRHDRIVELLRLVGLSERDLHRYSRSFSGGQRQRIAIARAVAVEPKVLVCDEPVSSLDVSVQAQVLNLLQDMQEQLGLTILFVAHDLAVVRQICSKLAVIEGGRVVEAGDAAVVLSQPQHPYTRSLLAAVPIPDPTVARAGTANVPPVQAVPQLQDTRTNS
jgi:oligopeptide transport system ATP-binding protein